MSDAVRLAWIAIALLGFVLLYRWGVGWTALQRERLLEQKARDEMTAAVAKCTNMVATLRDELGAHVDRLDLADKGLFERNDTQIKNLIAEVHGIVQAFETKQAAGLTSLARQGALGGKFGRGQAAG